MHYVTDPLYLKLYAQDASMYQELPEGVSFPRTVQDIVQLVRQAQLDEFAIIPRSAGTSLAGQTTGRGVIMDVSRYMTELMHLNSEERWAEVEPGVIRDTLNRAAADHNLQFGPDTATTNRCMIGGMIGNNSSGLFSIKHKTTREHVLEIEAVLSDGSVAVFKPLSPKELQEKLQLENREGHIYREMLELLKTHKERILANYPHPEIIRRNTGYALDKLCEMDPITPGGRPFNLCELLCGSEGTLAITTRAKLNLVELPKYKRLVIPHFNSLHEAMLATVEAVKFKPSAVELVDDIILNATKENLSLSPNRFFLQKDPRYILIIQFEGNDEALLQHRIYNLKRTLIKEHLGYAHPSVHEPNEIDKVWELRKAGLGLLMGLGKESRAPAFCEDTAVRVTDLPQYIREFQRLLKKYDADCVFYAHASVGELHLRPMIDTTTKAGVQKMKEMAEEIADLVATYRGSLSGEHGDGRARSPYIEKVLGSEMMPLLRQVKEIWDPHYIFNPGKIVDPEPLENNLRYSPQYRMKPIETMFAWRGEERGLEGMIERCNGAGVCRKLAESGGTMCPSYMATNNEKDSTRGRANVFRHVFEGKNPEGFSSPELKEALKLCLSCKGCKSECPANVDMAKMKAEFEYGWQLQRGISLKNRFFGEISRLYPLAVMLRPLSNWFIQSELGKLLLKSVVGISPKRTLPSFAAHPFIPKTFIPQHKGPKKVALFVDLFTRYHEPHVAWSAIMVLEFYGFEVIVPPVVEAGRAKISKGLLHKAKLDAYHMLEVFGPLVDEGVPIVGLEPSELLTLRDEFLDLVDEHDLEQAKKISRYAFLFEEFMYRLTPPALPEHNEQVLVHNHCHSKVLSRNTTLEKLLINWGYEVTMLDAGCCGMAGSFGYEHDNYELSMQIGAQRLFPSVQKLPKNNTVCAPGFSCRHQVFDGTGRKAVHPAELLAERLSGKVN